MSNAHQLLFLAAVSVLLGACESGASRDGAQLGDGLPQLAATREIPRGDSVCLGGGLALDSGEDTNRNDVLDASEVTSTTLLVCKSAPRVTTVHAAPDGPCAERRERQT